MILPGKAPLGIGGDCREFWSGLVERLDLEIGEIEENEVARETS